MKRQGWIGAVFVLLLVFHSSLAQGYTFTEDFLAGIYWQSFPIRMGLYASSESEALLLENVVRSAEDEWESVTGANIWDFDQAEVSSNYLQNHIRWSTNFAEETGYDPYGTLGVAIRYSRGTYFEKVIIVLNSNLSYLRQNFNNTLKKTILHELGHVIGLGHSNQSNAIMYYQISQAQSLHSDDQDGMRDLLDQTYYRQATGYVSPMVGVQEERNASRSSCGSSAIAFASDSSVSFNYGIGNIVSVFFGLIISTILLSFIRKCRCLLGR